MQIVEPKVFLIASTKVDYSGMVAYLESIGAKAFEFNMGGEGVIEVAARACYRSFQPGLNPNITKIREDKREYLGNILRQKHGSVLEHATATLACVNVSRVFTHEIVRHRAGMAFSQESLRYIRLDSLSGYFPDAFSRETMEKLWESVGDKDEKGKDAWLSSRTNAMKQLFIEHFEEAEKLQRSLSDLLDLDNCKDFDLKKKITSSMRRMAPIGLATSIIFTANHRALRHMLTMRTSRHAEEEIRKVFALIGDICITQWPNIYQDMRTEEVAGTSEITFENEKV